MWGHAASVGEVRSAAPLLQALKARAPQGKILLSTFTATGNRQARQIDAVDAVIFFPLDLIWIVRRALAIFDPALLVIIETEIWPNLIRQAYLRGVPALLLSGRLSARSLARYKLVRQFFARVLGCFSAFGMQSAEDAVRVVKLGAEQKKVSVVGTLKGARWTYRDTPNPSVKLRNGKPLLVRGAGWASDMLLRPASTSRLEAELRYVKEMGLNTIRLEGKLESDELYDLADREGILLMPGW